MTWFLVVAGLTSVCIIYMIAMSPTVVGVEPFSNDRWTWGRRSWGDDGGWRLGTFQSGVLGKCCIELGSELSNLRRGSTAGIGEFGESRVEFCGYSL